MAPFIIPMMNNWKSVLAEGISAEAYPLIKGGMLTMSPRSEMIPYCVSAQQPRSIVFKSSAGERAEAHGSLKNIPDSLSLALSAVALSLRRPEPLPTTPGQVQSPPPP